MLSRKSLGTLAAAAASGLLWAASAQALVNIPTVPVGDVGNTADSTGFGRVDYAYNIGKYEVTAGQYTAFLNAVGGVDTNRLYNPAMWLNVFGCKIERYTGSGTTASPYQYRVAADDANRPVNFVSFWDACRFTNWLQNGQKSGAQDASTTESGAYSLNGVTNPINSTITRNTGWQWAVTSENEWYKAAYYKGGSTNAGYYLYPTSSDTAPGQNMADPLGNNANYLNADPIDNGHYTTVVGEFQNSDSPYGTFDQGGNVLEWNEAIIIDSYRGLRGGSFYSYDISLQSSTRIGYNPTNEGSDIGFRVSQVPEPASVALLGLGVTGMLLRRRGAAK